MAEFLGKFDGWFRHSWNDLLRGLRAFADTAGQCRAIAELVSWGGWPLFFSRMTSLSPEQYGYGPSPLPHEHFLQLDH